MDRWRTRDWRDRDEHYNEDRDDRYYRGERYRGGDQYGSYGGYEAYDRGMARGSDRGFANDYAQDRDRGYYDRDRPRDYDRGYFDRGNYGSQRDIRPMPPRETYRDRDRMMRSDAGPAWERTVGHGFEFDRDDVRRDGWTGRAHGDRDHRDREYGRDYWDDYPWSSRRW